MTSPPASLLAALSANPKTSDRRRNSGPADPKVTVQCMWDQKREEEESTFGSENRAQEINENHNNYSNESNTSKLGDSLKRKLLGPG
ncbi:unnamed protein product [Camellia sinensis]